MMWNIGQLLYDACAVSSALVHELACLEQHLSGASPESDCLMVRAFNLDASLQRMHRAVRRVAALVVDVGEELEPRVDQLWDGLVGVTAGGMGAWNDEAAASWSRAVEQLEELALIIAVVTEQAPRVLEHAFEPVSRCAASPMP